MAADCERCEFAEMTLFEPCAHETEGILAYECRRFPPVPLMVTSVDGGQGEAVQTWPTVHAGDYCGEFKERAA